MASDATQVYKVDYYPVNLDMRTTRYHITVLANATTTMGDLRTMVVDDLVA